MILAGGLEADDHWPTEVEQVTHETIMFGLGVQHNQPAALAHPGNLDQYIVAQFEMSMATRTVLGRVSLILVMVGLLPSVDSTCTVEILWPGPDRLPA